MQLLPRKNLLNFKWTDYNTNNRQMEVHKKA